MDLRAQCGRRLASISAIWLILQVSLIVSSSPWSAAMSAPYNDGSESALNYLCGQDDVALASNDNNGTIVTFVNTQTGRTSEVTIPDRYIPTSDICGQYFDMCNTVSLTSENRTVVVLPLNDSVGLALRNSENGTDNDSLQWHTVSPTHPAEASGCTFIYFVTVQRNEVVGYCIKLGILYTFDIIFSYTSLDLSGIRPRIVGNMHPLGTSANRTNFVHFDNDPGDSCFSTEGPYVFFLVNNALIEHSFSDGFATVGTIETSTTCTRLQRIGECELAAYCGREVFTFSIHDQDRVNFAPTLVPLTGDGGRVFLCSSSYLVYLRNNLLTLYDRNTLSPRDNPIYTQLDEEAIIRGKCQGSEIDSTAFVITLQSTNSSYFLYRITLMHQDSSATTVNITDITPTYAIDTMSGDVGSDAAVAQTRSRYAIVSNGTITFIFNWMLPCNVNSLLIQSAFMFISFITTGSTYQCRCPVSDSDLTSPTITTRHTTFSGPEDSQSLDYGIIIIIVIFCIVAVLVGVMILCFILYYICQKKFNGKSEHPNDATHEQPTSDFKDETGSLGYYTETELNERNNNVHEELNNIEYPAAGQNDNLSAQGDHPAPGASGEIKTPVRAQMINLIT